MEKLRVHNKRLDAWFIVYGGKVFDASTMKRLPASSYEAKGAIKYVKERMDELWDKMGEINPIWGDLQLYHQYERKWLLYREALYGLN